MTWLLNLLQLIELLRGVFDDMSDKLGQFLEDVWAAFPNVIGMADAVIRLTSGLLGIVIGRSATIYWRMFAREFEKPGELVPENFYPIPGRPYQHVMTPSNALNFVAKAGEVWMQTITFTGETGLAAALASFVGRFLWNLWKRFKFIREVMGWKTEADVIAWSTRWLAKKKDFAGLVAVVAAFAVFSWICLTFSGLFVSLAAGSIKDDLWRDFVLFSGHKRKKEKVRIYRRVGGVAP